MYGTIHSIIEIQNQTTRIVSKINNNKKKAQSRNKNRNAG